MKQRGNETGVWCLSNNINGKL